MVTESLDEQMVRVKWIDDKCDEEILPVCVLWNMMKIKLFGCFII